MTREAAHKGGFMGLIVAILIALGLWAPSPVPPPMPTPTPTVAPTAPPTPSPVVEACQLPPSEGGNCSWPPPVASVYRHKVEDAVQMVPARFLDSDGKVKDEHAFVLEVAKILRQRFGLCAIQGKSVADEVWVKGSNDFSEHWDVVRADNAPIPLYASRCVPAGF